MQQLSDLRRKAIIRLDPPPPDLLHRGHRSQVFYSNIQLLIPIIITITATIICIAFTVVCYKYRQRGRERKDTMEGNQQSTDAQRDRYYATIHKVALQAGDKIPETSEDISPYATFQLSEASTLAQPHHSGPANTLLHSFMYHERAMTEGCASPPPAANSSKGRRRHSRKTEPESEESDSDQDQLTSSRTESSNQLDAKIKHSLIYHGTQSSTSSDLSPMSEQKSLPRRGRSRYHHLHLHNTNTTPRHKSSLSSKNTVQSPIASPRSSCQNDTQTIQLPRMPSQFRPIHSSRTINTPSRLSSDC